MIYIGITERGEWQEQAPEGDLFGHLVDHYARQGYARAVVEHVIREYGPDFDPYLLAGLTHS